ncbi:MAG: NAD(P)/FAD-dependent oxidoreductase [Flavobacterium sp.]
MLDYIIVGSGLAGISFAECCIQHQQKIRVFQSDLYQSSKVAGGLYNPVILKRFTLAWKSEEHVAFALNFYQQLEDKLHRKMDHSLPLYRVFHDVAEQNDWFVSSDKPKLTDWLDSKIELNDNEAINAPFGLGKVLKTGYVDTKLLLDLYHAYLVQQQVIDFSVFDYQSIIFHKDGVEYKGYKAKHLVFAEGYGLKSNPFFGHLPLDGTKGEVLKIYAPALNLKHIIKKQVFIVPLVDDFYRVGATYDWNDKTEVPTESGKQELISGLKEIVKVPFEIVEHVAGVRPTVKDRKPMLGTHPNHKNLHVLNGMGTRGVLLAPNMAWDLFQCIQFGTPLDAEVNISRFKKLLW